MRLIGLLAVMIAVLLITSLPAGSAVYYYPDGTVITTNEPYPYYYFPYPGPYYNPAYNPQRYQSLDQNYRVGGYERPGSYDAQRAYPPYLAAPPSAYPSIPPTQVFPSR